MRAAAACLLTEYFNVNWVAGAAWFHENLVDADTAVNAMMWQNAGVCVCRGLVGRQKERKT